MAFTFKPYTDEEINLLHLLEPGEGIYEVLEAKEDVSEKGNQMIVLKMKVWDKNEKEKVLTDYLMDIPAFAYKIKHFCESHGLEEKYKQGILEMSDFKGKMGKLKIIIQKDKKGVYPDKSAVGDYLKTEAKKAEGFHDDSFPF